MRSKGSRLYYLSHTTKVIESEKTIYFEEDIGTSQNLEKLCSRRNASVQEHVTSAPLIGPMIDQNLVITHDESADQVVQETPNVDVDDGDALLNRSQRTHRPVISNGFAVYFQEHEFDIGC